MSEIKSNVISQQRHKIGIEGHGKEKQRHNLAYDSPVLSLRTVNKYFELNLTYCATIDYFCLLNFIDSAGGVMIDVMDYELEWAYICITDIVRLNSTMNTGNRIRSPASLNRYHSVGYSRIRKAGERDYERTDAKNIAEQSF